MVNIILEYLKGADKQIGKSNDDQDINDPIERSIPKFTYLEQWRHEIQHQQRHKKIERTAKMGNDGFEKRVIFLVFVEKENCGNDELNDKTNDQRRGNHTQVPGPWL